MDRSRLCQNPLDVWCNEQLLWVVFMYSGSQLVTAGQKNTGHETDVDECTSAGIFGEAASPFRA